MSLQDDFRRRLRDAIERVGRKAVTRLDGVHKHAEVETISQGGLTKILGGERPNPGIFTVKTIADRAGVTVGQLLGEPGYEITEADRERAREFAAWLTEKFSLTEGRETGSPNTSSVDAANVARFPEKTRPKWTPEFPVEPTDFNDAGDTDYPLELHGYELEDIDAAAGGAGIETDMPTTLLSSKEVRESRIRTIRVRGDSMSPEYEEGWKLAVDVTKQNQEAIPQGEPVIIYRKDEGMILGWWRREGSRVLLEKENAKYPAVELQPGDRLVGTIAYVAWKPARRRAQGRS